MFLKEQQYQNHVFTFSCQNRIFCSFLFRRIQLYQYFIFPLATQASKGLTSKYDNLLSLITLSLNNSLCKLKMEKENIIPSTSSIKVRLVVPSRERVIPRSHKSILIRHPSSRKVPLAGIHTLKNFYEKSKEDPLNTSEFIKQYSKLPAFCKHSRIEQVNTFSLDRTDSLFANSKLLISYGDRSARTTLNEDCLGDLISHAISAESKQAILQSYEQLRKSCTGFGLNGMVILFGVQLYMVFSNYTAASELLHQLLFKILEEEREEYLVVFLRVKIVSLSNINQNGKAIAYLKKLLKLSWLFELEDIEMWCYHHMSKLYLGLHQLEFSKIMMIKFEEGIPEGNSKNRPVYVESIEAELINMKKSKSDFDLENDDLDIKLLRTRNSEEQQPINQLKEIRYMAIQMFRQKKDSRIFRVLPKIFKQRIKNKCESDMQIQLVMTHLSKIKNFNTYFRETSNPLNASWDFITIENPSLNWPVLREILRKICVYYLKNACSETADAFFKRRF